MGALNLVDFDAAFDDADDKPLTVRLLGTEWVLPAPSQVPAALLLRIDRLMLQVAAAEKDGADLPDDLVIDEELSLDSVARRLVGDDTVDAWLEQGLPYARLGVVVRRLLAIYKGQDQGEAPAANRQTRRAAARPRKAAAAKGSRSTKSSPRGR